MKQTLEQFLETQSAWFVSGETLVGNWRLNDFREVQSLVQELCQLADSHNHHPTVTFDYNSVRIETTTHDAGNTVTQKDIDLAEQISHLMAR